MKLIKDLLFFLTIFIVSTFLCAVVAMTALSYYAVNELAKATAPDPQSKPGKKLPSVKASMVPTTPDFSVQDAADPNLKSLVKIGSDYRTELTIFDQLFNQIAQKQYPEFCSVLCNPTSLDKERLKQERSPYLAEFYKEHGLRALEDPIFRMKLAEVDFISRLFPHSLRDILGDIQGLHDRSKESRSRLLLAIRLEAAVIAEMSALTLRLDSMKGEADKFRDIRALIQSCQKGTMTHKSVRNQCEAILSI